MVTETIEEMIVAMERKGWRLSSLSHINGYARFSCILERKKTGDDGFPVYAVSELRPTAREAVYDAWTNAQRPIENAKVFRKSAAPTVVLTDLGKWLSNHVGYRVRLEDALSDLTKALGGAEDDSDAFL